MVAIRLREIGRPGARAPVLVVHDGSDYLRRAALTRLLRAHVAARELPPHRLALLEPEDRGEDYSASARYARELARAVEELGGPRAALGASLGALALLHAHRLEPRAFAGLFLQSGSYFRRRTDPQESGFRRFSRVDRFVGTVLAPRDRVRPVPTTITCALDEENYANNAALAHALAVQGYPVDFHASRGAHDWPTWRRALAPHLAPLLRRAWR